MTALTRRAAGRLMGGMLVAGAARADASAEDWSGARIFRLAGCGQAGFAGDAGPAIEACLNGPAGVGVDREGRVLIADLRNNAIRRVDTGGHIATIAGTGQPGFAGDGGLAVEAQLNRPEGVAADSRGNIFIADSGNDRIRRVDSSGRIETLAGGGREDPCHFEGEARALRLKHPSGIAADAAGAVIFSDYGHDIVCAIGPDGAMRRVAGTGAFGYDGDGGPARAALLNDVYGIALDPHGVLYICDSLNFAVRRVQGGVIDTAVRGLSGVPHKKGTIGSQVPHGVEANSNGDIFVADTAAHHIVLHSARGIETIAGSGRPGVLVADGTGALQAAIDVHGLRCLPGGDLVFPDYLQNVVYRLKRS